MHSSVRENISYGRSNASDKEIIKAAHAADAHEFIRDLPQGYDTIVGQKGRRLSGGQRQRIALARAIVKDAPVLILDEPTTSLDTPTAQRILGPLRRAMNGRANILISHDMLAVRDASQILVLNGGRIVESGTHESLNSINGDYATLCHNRSTLQTVVQ